MPHHIALTEQVDDEDIPQDKPVPDIRPERKVTEMSKESNDSRSRAKSRMKRYGLPAGLLAGGLALGSMVMPIGLANAHDGSTTTDSAAADSAPTDSTAGPRGHGRGGPRAGAGSEVVQELLGMTHEEIRAALEGGQTLAELAEAEGVTEADLVAALVAEATERIDAAVAEDRIDEAKAAELKEDLEARITERVTTIRERMEDGGRGPGGGHGRGGPRGGAAGETTTTTEA